MVNGKQKGARVEREAASALRDSLGIEARRSVQYSGTAGDADLISTLPSVHFEVKARKSIGALRFMDQAVSDSDASGALPVVLLRENGDPSFYALVKLSDLPALSKKILSIQALEEISKLGEEIQA